MRQADEGLKDVVPAGTQMERVATGFQFTEGPAWDGVDALYFSDIPADTIYRLDAAGKVTVFLKPSGKSNGLTFDRDGTLLACRHWARNVARISRQGEVTVVAEAYGGKKLNSPNDLVVAADGAIYFTDPHYGLEGRPPEQEVEGVYRVAQDGAITRVVSDMTRPNGLGLSPDGRTLYVADSEERKLRAYALRPDGSTENGRDLIDMRTDEPGVPDGLRLDAEGRIYATGGGGVWVITPEGRHLGTIRVPEVPANCEFGGPERNALYLTARSSVYRIALNVHGRR